MIKQAWKNVSKSSNLNRVRYYSDISILAVEFKSGDLYLYGNVPEEHYRGLLRAKSRGKYFSAHIRENKEYPHQQITREEALAIPGFMPEKKGD
jgi:hypothetical protein